MSLPAAVGLSDLRRSLNNPQALSTDAMIPGFAVAQLMSMVPLLLEAAVQARTFPANTGAPVWAVVVAGLGGGTISALLTWILGRNRMVADIRKTASESEKYEAETEKLRLETERLRRELADSEASLTEARGEVLAAVTDATQLLQVAASHIDSEEYAVLQRLMERMHESDGRQAISHSALHNVLQHSQITADRLMQRRLLRRTPVGFELTALGRQALATVEGR